MGRQEAAHAMCSHPARGAGWAQRQRWKPHLLCQWGWVVVAAWHSAHLGVLDLAGSTPFLQAHYGKYEPTILELKRKYESAMKEKMLAGLERDKMAAKVGMGHAW